MPLNDDIQHQEVTQGKYAVSIPTSLALETLFGINDNIPVTKPLPYTQYQFLSINILTLLRNIYSTVSVQLKSEWSAEKYLKYVLDEIADIPRIIEDQSQDKLRVVFYLPSYRSLNKEFKHALMKSTHKKAYGKQHQEAIEQYVSAQIRAQVLRIGEDQSNIYLIDVKLPTPPKDAGVLVLTHQPVDLVSYSHLTHKVALLESHTGVIKDRFKWYTKFGAKPPGVEYIPFRKWSLIWFGDGKFFSAYPTKYRAALIEFAIENRWNQSTSDQLIKAQAKRIKDPEMKQELLNLL